MSARVGLVVPSSNTVMEVDLARGLPPGATLHTARMHLVETTPAGESRMLDDHLPQAIADLASLRPAVAVFGCTSAGALRGDAAEAELVETLARETGAPAISVNAAVRAAIARRGARRVGVLTPYVDALTERIADGLAADGLDVADTLSLRIDDNFAIAGVTPEEIVRLAAGRFAGAGVDLLFCSCTNFRALEARETLERRLGVPVVTSNQAALEALERVLAEQPAVAS